MDASTKEYKRGKCLICTTVVFQAYCKAAQLSGLMQMIGMLPMVLFLPFAKPLTEKFGKKEASAFCSIFSVIACIVMNIVPMPANMTGVLIYVGLSFVHGVGLGCGMMMANAMMADAIDYNEWKFGKREESITYAIHSFFRKLAQGVGPSIGLVVMVMVGYDEVLGGAQPMDVATNLRYVMTGFTLLSSLLNFVAIKFIYPLDKKTLAQMNKDLGC